MALTAQELVSINCSTCSSQIRLGHEQCPSCGREVTRDERDALRRRWEGTDPEAARLGDVVAYGRAALLVVAGLSLIEAFVYGALGESAPAFVFGVAISAIMVALFFFGRRRPLAAMVVGLAAYLGLQALAATVSMLSVFQGLLFKVLIIAALGSGIGAEVHRRRQEKKLLRRRPA